MHLVVARDDDAVDVAVAEGFEGVEEGGVELGGHAAAALGIFVGDAGKGAAGKALDA